MDSKQLMMPLLESDTCSHRAEAEGGGGEILRTQAEGEW